MYADSQICMIVAAACVFWGFFLQTTKVLLPHRTAQFNSRVISMLHSMISAVANTFSAYCLLQQGNNIGERGGELQSWVQGMSAGYFVIDLIDLLLSDYCDTVFVLHHIVSITGCLYGAWGWGALENAMSIALLEMANPLLHLRWLLVELEKQSSGFFQFVDSTFLLLFAVTRLIVGPALIYMMVTAATPSPVFYIFAGVGFVTLSFMFFVEVMKKVWAGEQWNK